MLSITSSINLFLDCKCLDFVDSDGYGNCMKRDHRFKGAAYSCYVKESSHCEDKTYADYTSGERITLSAYACLTSNYTFYVVY